MKQDNKITLLAGICSLALLGFSPQMYATNKAELSMSVQQTKKITGTVYDSQGAIIGATVKGNW